MCTRRRHECERGPESHRNLLHLGEVTTEPSGSPADSRRFSVKAPASLCCPFRFEKAPSLISMNNRCTLDIMAPVYQSPCSPTCQMQVVMSHKGNLPASVVPHTSSACSTLICRRCMKQLRRSDTEAKSC